MRFIYRFLIVLFLVLMQPFIAISSAREINERVLLLYPAVQEKKSDLEKHSRLSAYEGIAEQLADNGFRIVDKASAEKSSLQIAAISEIDPYINKAASFGLKFFAEYTAYFKTRTIINDREEHKGAMVRVEAKIIENTSGQIIASKNAEYSSSGLTLEDAMEKAARTAGKKLGKILAIAMEKNLARSEIKGKIYTVIIESNSSNPVAISIRNGLEQSTRIAGIREIESGGGKTTFEIIYKGKRDQLDGELTDIAEKSEIKMQKIRSEGTRSMWKIN